jgi:hypothetical protein
VEGVYDTKQSKLNVSNVIKPSLDRFERQSFTLDELKKISSEHYKDRAI